jgi:hypothetical protein
MSGVRFVENDTGSRLYATLIDNVTEEAIDLSGATVRLIYKIGGGAEQTRTMTITASAAGKAEYLFLTGELASGAMKGDIEIEDSFGNRVTSLESFYFGVRAKAL